MTVLADTGPLVAGFNVRDQYHDRARAEMATLEGSRRSVATTVPVLAEAYSFLLYRLGPALARSWLTEVRQSAAVVEQHQPDLAAAAEVLEQFSDQDLSLVDALTAVASVKLGLAVWTYDHHFDVMGVDVWRG